MTRRNAKASAKNDHPNILRVILVLTAGFAALVYAGSLNNSFVTFDDPEILFRNSAILNLDFSRILFHPVASDYVPVTLLSFALEKIFFGLNAFYFHLDNLILHIINSILVNLLVYRISARNLFIAMFAGIVFAVHPMHVESVAWVTERKDVLCTLFFLLSCHSYMGYLEAKSRDEMTPFRKNFILCMVFFVLALLSKSVAVSLPLVLILLDYQKARKLDSTAWLEKVPFFAVSVVFSVLHLFVHYRPRTPERIQLPAWQPIVDGANSLVHYLAKSVWPTNLAAFYAREAVSVPLADYAIALAVVAVLLAGAELNRGHRRDFIFGIGFFVVTVLPVLQFISFGNDFLFADRYMYVPSIGLFYAFGVILSGELFKEKKNRKLFRPVALVIFSGIFAALSAMSIQNTKIWKNSEALWQDVLKKYPNTSMAYFNLGVDRYLAGAVDQAIEFFRKALSINPKYVNAYVNLGVSLADKGMTTEAVATFNEALKIAPNDPGIHTGMANALSRSGDLGKAIQELKKAIDLNPEDAEAYFMLGGLFGRTGATDDAIKILEKGLELSPGSPEAHHNLGNAYLDKNDLEKAALHYRLALTADTNLPNTHLSLANVYAAMGLADSALDEYKKTLELNPRSEAAHSNLGLLYLRTGSFQNAEEEYKKALDINSKYSIAHRGLAEVYRKEGRASEADQEALKGGASPAPSTSPEAKSK